MSLWVTKKRPLRPFIPTELPAPMTCPTAPRPASVLPVLHIKPCCPPPITPTSSFFPHVPLSPNVRSACVLRLMMIPPGTLPARLNSYRFRFSLRITLPCSRRLRVSMPCQTRHPLNACPRSPRGPQPTPYDTILGRRSSCHEDLYLRSRRDFREIGFRSRYGSSPRFQGQVVSKSRCVEQC